MAGIVFLTVFILVLSLSVYLLTRPSECDTCKHCHIYASNWMIECDKGGIPLPGTCGCKEYEKRCK